MQIIPSCPICLYDEIQTHVLCEFMILNFKTKHNVSAGSHHFNAKLTNMVASDFYNKYFLKVLFGFIKFY